MFQKNPNFQWLKMLDIPAMILGMDGKIIWYNDAAEFYFNYDGLKCKYYIQNSKSKSNGKHCEKSDFGGCIMLNIINDFIESQDLKKQKYQKNEEIWEITFKPLPNEHVLLYGIECTNQKRTEMVLEKYLQGIDEYSIENVRPVEGILSKIDFESVFRLILESLATPVIIFHNEEVVFINESYVNFAGSNIKKFTAKLRSKLKLINKKIKHNKPQQLIIQFDDDGEKTKTECVLIPYKSNTFAIIIN